MQTCSLASRASGFLALPLPPRGIKAAARRVSTAARAYIDQPGSGGGGAIAGGGKCGHAHAPLPVIPPSGGTWVESDLEECTGYECASCWHTDEHADPAQPLQAGARLAPARRTSAAGPSVGFVASPGAMMAQRSASVSSLDEASLEGLSDNEDWVFKSACEGAACWQADLALEDLELPASGAATNGWPKGAGAVLPPKQPPKVEEPAPEFALFDSGSCPSSQALTRDIALEEWMTAEWMSSDDDQQPPAAGRQRSESSLLDSVDGMGGNIRWECLSDLASPGPADDPASAAAADMASSEDLSRMLADLQELEVVARSTAGSLSGSGGSLTGSSDSAGEGMAGMTDLE